MKHLFLSIILLFSVELSATKPCASPPCYTDSTSSLFDREKCKVNSDWVATGEINILSHDYKGMPLNKDFLTFEFETKQWEKGEKLSKHKITFQVGWCKNQFFPKKGDGSARIYGVVTNNSDGEEYRFLYIERL